MHVKRRALDHPRVMRETNVDVAIMYSACSAAGQQQQRFQSDKYSAFLYIYLFIYLLFARFGYIKRVIVAIIIFQEIFRHRLAFIY